jgi:tRNA(Ile)-lysidine synthase
MSSLPRLQELPPKWARFCLGIGRFATQELGRTFSSTACVVACSGGADSTALLLLSALLCRKDGGRVVAAHLDHGLREKSSADAAFVAGLCDRMGIPLVSGQQDVSLMARESGIGLEEAGRLARYDLLERARRNSGAELVLLGHQLNDLAEDQLLRLMRGAGWPALGGMAGHDAQRCLLRPLLLTSRATLEEFLRVCGQTWRVDQSNFELTATRNRVRHELLPVLMRENPSYLDAAARLWRQARMDETHWDAEVTAALEALPEPSPDKKFLLPAQTLKTTPAPLRLRLYKAVLESFGPGQALSDSLFRLDELWQQSATGKTLRFPGDKEAAITKSGIVMRVIDRKKECG